MPRPQMRREGNAMFRSIILGQLVIAITGTLFAQEPPPPQEVANTISNYWMGSNFTSLGSYITNLYTSYSNYVPAILAGSFYDVVYQGKLSDATNKLYRVQALVTSSPTSFTDLFKDMLSGLIDDVSEEITLHGSMGTTPSQLEPNASPSAVRSASSRLDRDIIILFSAPATNAP